jgi:hypothetical protein
VKRHTVPIIVAAVMLGFSIISCCGAGGGVDVESGDSGSVSKPDNVGESRSNPASPGSIVTVGDFTLQVGDVTRPADDIVLAGNMFNTEPEEGQEYVMVEITVGCLDSADDQCVLVPWLELELVGDQSVTYSAETTSGVDDTLDSVELYGGGSTTGYVFFIVEEDDTNLVLVFDGLLRQAFLALPE